MGDGDDVQRAVELAVAAPIEAVALLLARAGVKWADAGEAGEMPVGLEPGDVADVAEDASGGQNTAAGISSSALPWRMTRTLSSFLSRSQRRTRSRMTLR